MVFILCADLHLKEKEKDYSFAVLDEVLNYCAAKKCVALLLAGDVFDSRDDLENLRAEFRSALEKLPSSCAVYFLPGNHEELRADNSSNLSTFDFGRAILLDKKPWSLISLDEDTELLALPFQRDYSEYRSWEVPPKKKPLRILLAHGTVPGITYTGPSEETDSIIDEDLFARFSIDIAALGHIHKQICVKKGDALAAYPGSSRVWREGEEGKRCVLLGDTKLIPPRFEQITLASAGEYRVIPVFANPEGELNYRLPEEKNPADWLHLFVEGVVEEEPSVMNALEKLNAELEKKYRRVSCSTEKLSVLAGVSTHPLAIRFLNAWKNASNSYAKEDDGVYEMARMQGLLSIKEILEARK